MRFSATGLAGVVPTVGGCEKADVGRSSSISSSLLSFCADTNPAGARFWPHGNHASTARLRPRRWAWVSCARCVVYTEVAVWLVTMPSFSSSNRICVKEYGARACCHWR